MINQWHDDEGKPKVQKELQKHNTECFPALHGGQIQLIPPFVRSCWLSACQALESEIRAAINE